MESEGEKLDIQEYFRKVESQFSETTLHESSPGKIVAYEEVFKWKWFATKLKIFSFVTYSSIVDLQMFRSYSEDCFQYAKKNKKGLPLGWQNGVVSFNVMVSDSIPQEVASFSVCRPKKHYSAFEIPVAVDISANRNYFYQGEIIWGMLYNDFFKAYISNHFAT